MANSKKDRLVKYNRDNILEAAKTLFQAKGVAQTTVDDIARQADCSKSTLYMYFPSKDDIYHTIVREYMALLKDGVAKVKESHSDFCGRYYALCGKLVEFKNQYALYFESMLGSISVEPSDLEPGSALYEIRALGEETNAMLGGIFHEALLKKELREDIEPLPTAFILWGSICAIINMVYNKAAYIQLALDMDQQTFMQKGFSTLLQGILPLKARRNK